MNTNITLSNIKLENVQTRTIGGRSGMLIGLKPAGNISSNNIILNDCKFEIYECEQNTGKSPIDGSNLGLKDGLIRSYAYIVTTESYKPAEESFDPKSLVSNATLGSVSGWDN